MRLIFTNLNLLDGVNPGKASVVAIEGKHIVAVMPTIAELGSTSGDTIIDLGGKTLMPGMVSGHFHTTYHNLGAEPGLPLMEHPPAFTAYRGLANVQTALACGFTSVVGAGCVYDIDPSLEKAIEAGLVVGPRMVPCSRDMLTSADQTLPWWTGSPIEQGINYCDGPVEVTKAVRSEIRRGARVIGEIFASGGHGAGVKGCRNFTREELSAAVAAAHDRGVRVRAHVVGKKFILECIEVGFDILDHCDEMDEECIEAMVEAGVFVLPSLNLPLMMMKHPMFGFATDQIKADFDAMCAILPKAAAAGVKLCVGDDFGAAGMPHGDYANEMALYVEHAGIAPLEVIKWATRNGGALTGRGHELGTIETGKLADIVVVDGDPSTDIRVLCERSRIDLVMRGGRIVAGARQDEYKRMLAH